MTRTMREFPVSSDLWPIVDRWAKAEGFRLVNGGGEQRTYQKGHGFWVAPMMCEIESDGRSVHLEAWIRANLFVRLMSLFLLPAEMGVEGGGFRAVVPRRIARGRVNKLLADLDQPAIP